MKTRLTSILTCAIFVASFSLVPNKVEARWFAAMDIDIVYDTASSSASGEVGVSADGGNVGGSTSSSGSGVAGVLYECNFALASCDTSQQRYVPVEQ